jgi:GntR family histidine utilization transcriptional repressor
LNAHLPVSLDGDGPLWGQIRRAIEQPILAGTWRAGTVIPSEHELMAQYGAARMTVNRAVRSLAAQGVVERRRRRGTVVAATAPERPILEIWDIAADCARSGTVYGLELLDRALIRAGDDDGFQPAPAPATRLLRLTARHRADGVAIQLEERVISLAAVPEAEAVDFAATGPGQWLLGHVPWTEAEHAIHARAAPKSVAERLEIARGTPCLVIERQTWNGDVPITFVRLWHPGDRHRLRGRFRRDKG